LVKPKPKKLWEWTNKRGENVRMYFTRSPPGHPDLVTYTKYKDGRKISKKRLIIDYKNLRGK